MLGTSRHDWLRGPRARLRGRRVIDVDIGFFTAELRHRDLLRPCRAPGTLRDESSVAGPADVRGLRGRLARDLLSRSVRSALRRATHRSCGSSRPRAFSPSSPTGSAPGMRSSALACARISRRSARAPTRRLRPRRRSATTASARASRWQRSRRSSPPGLRRSTPRASRARSPPAQGHDRAHRYGRIWSVMHELQDDRSADGLASGRTPPSR